MTKIESASQLRQILGVSAAASFGTLIEEIDAAASYVEDSYFSSYSLYILVRARIQKDPQTLTNFVLTPDALRILNEGQIPEFFRTFGDAFVADIQRGGDLYALLEFSCKTRAQFDYISDQIHECVVFFDGEADFSKSMSTISQEITTKIRVVKNGGLNTLPDMQALIDAAVHFPQEFTSDADYVIVGFHLSDYYTATNRPIGKPLPDISASIDALEMLAMHRDAIVLLLNDIDSILKFPAAFEPYDPQKLQASREIVANDLQIVLNAAKVIKHGPLASIVLPILHYQTVRPLPNWRDTLALSVRAAMDGGADVTVGAGQWAGRPGSPVRLGIRSCAISISPALDGLSINYSIRNGLEGGSIITTGKDGQLICCASIESYYGYACELRVWLVGPIAAHYDVVYSAYMFNQGETAEASNGGVCGASPGIRACCGCSLDELVRRGTGLYMEAIKVAIRRRPHTVVKREQFRQMVLPPQIPDWHIRLPTLHRYDYRKAK